MSNFRDVDRQTAFLLPSVDEWLPERHLARFIVEVIEKLDLRAMSGSYRGSGSASYHPSMLLGLVVYGYATGVFTSRKLERATYDSVAFRFIAANDHPDHDTKLESDSLRIEKPLLGQAPSSVGANGILAALPLGCPQPLPTSFANVSRRPIVRLNTGWSGVESLSRTK